MIELFNTDNPFAGANLIFLLVIILLSTAFFVCFSGFIKYNIVLNIIKNAIGTQQIPPSLVINLLAALMAINSIWPAVQPGVERIKKHFVINKNDQTGILDLGTFLPQIEGGYDFINPTQDPDGNKNTMIYLLMNLEFFFPELKSHAINKTAQLLSIIELPILHDYESNAHKYLIGSLILDMYSGFELGLKIYLIFVSIDFLVAVILSGVGMSMLSPTVISVPIKMSVFYLSDSWTLFFRVMS